MQLDFFSIGQKAPQEQFNLWTDDLSKAAKPKAAIKYEKVEEFFRTLNSKEITTYKEYWGRLVPENDVERFKRYIFSFLSVHSTWENNVKSYNLLKNWTEWFNRPEILKEKLIESKVGLFNNRTKFIQEFSEKYWNNPDTFKKSDDENWASYRNRLEKLILGLGFAKTSFAIELLYPNRAEVACTDVHIYRMYGLSQKRDMKQGSEIEKHFVQMSKLWNCPPAIARGVLWDRLQNKPSPAYWAYVFEKQ